MRKLLVFLTATLLLTGELFAQKTITGRVTDEKGNPIGNASVTVKGHYCRNCYQRRRIIHPKPTCLS
jgi:hypothetical protein